MVYSVISPLVMFSVAFLRRTFVGQKVVRRSFANLGRSIDVSADVKEALKAGKPVVALESTIITHGMPHPHNVETAVDVESIVRNEGAVPATIAIVNGRVKVGLSREELEFLAKPNANCVKTSRRDFPYVLAKRLNGGTTVSGTLMIAGLVGIKVFVTGGIGGVHRQGETSMDISADLVEMGKQPVMVVSSGVKSILDIGRTLEYLETQGVCVMSYGRSKDFPAFYTQKSGFTAPYSVANPVDAAKALFESHRVGAGSGILLAVPIPNEYSLDEKIMNDSVGKALEDAEKAGVRGKEVTPFVLERVSRITSGKSLTSNIALIRNNALVGAKVAVEYASLSGVAGRSKAQSGEFGQMIKSSSGKIVVVGGSVLDCVMAIQTELKADGRTLPGKISQTPGGVGRNVADSLGKLRSAVSFVSAVGNDQFGQFLLKSVHHLDTSCVIVDGNSRTACYGALVDSNGDAKIGIGDMEIHQRVTPYHIAANRDYFADSSLIVVDGNMTEETIKSVLELSLEEHVPVWFEPTDILKAPKPFRTELWTTLSCISPNMNELKEMAKAVGLKFDEKLNLGDVDGLLRQLTFLSQPLVEHIPVVMVTMGKLGLLMVSRCQVDESPRNTLTSSNGNQMFARYYPCVTVENVKNSLGAGDNTAAGFIDGLLRGCTEPECVQLGHQAARESLQSSMAVPEHFESYNPNLANRATFYEISMSCS